MKQDLKQRIHQQSKEHVASIQTKIKDMLKRIQNNISKGKKEINQMGRADQMVQVVLTAYNQKRAEELILLHPSPYFVRCDIELDTKEKKLFILLNFILSKKRFIRGLRQPLPFDLKNLELFHIPNQMGVFKKVC